MFDANGQAHQILTDARTCQFLRIELPVCRCGGVTGQGFGITNVDQAVDQLQGIDEFRAILKPAGDAETENA